MIRLAKYKIVLCPRGVNLQYCVKRKKWWSPIWRRCKGLQPLYDIFETVEEAKAAIPLYDRGTAYWVGTMTTLTAERLGVKDEKAQ